MPPRADDGEDLVAQGGDLVGGAGLDVEAQQRFGVGRAQVEPPAVAQVTVSPSRSSTVTPGRPAKAARTAAVRAGLVGDACELISPDAA